MQASSICVLMAILAVILFIILALRTPLQGDEKYRMGEQAITSLTQLLDSGKEIPEITRAELTSIRDKILLVADQTNDVNSTTEGMSYFQDNNTRLWQRYYYSFPYSHKYGGAWPPNMFSRLKNWSPGFYTTGSGWSYAMRPGMGYKQWPRNRWVRSKGSYYLIRNGEDWIHDAADYSDPAFAYI